MESGPLLFFWGAAPENSRPPPLPGWPGRGPIALSKAEARSSPVLAHPDGHDGGNIHRPSCFRSGCPHHEAGDILGGELDTDVGPEGVNAEVAEILVEVPKLGRQHHRLNADGGRPFD